MGCFGIAVWTDQYVIGARPQTALLSDAGRKTQVGQFISCFARPQLLLKLANFKIHWWRWTTPGPRVFSMAIGAVCELELGQRRGPLGNQLGEGIMRGACKCDARRRKRPLRSLGISSPLNGRNLQGDGFWIVGLGFRLLSFGRRRLSLQWKCLVVGNGSNRDCRRCGHGRLQGRHDGRWNRGRWLWLRWRSCGQPESHL